MTNNNHPNKRSMAKQAAHEEFKREAYEKAVDSLARYKFIMFGYWAAMWCNFNKIDGNVDPNPFRQLVVKAREMKQGSQDVKKEVIRWQ